MPSGFEPLAHPLHYPLDGAYSDLLAWHLYYWGTRPDGSTTTPGHPWADGEFQTAFYGKIVSETVRISPQNWLGVGAAPSAPREDNAKRVGSIIFGNNSFFDDWRNDLEEARKRSLKGKNRRTRQFPKPPNVVPPTASLPRLATHFIGRDGERDELARALLSSVGSGAILIQGGPGIGKTELTKAVAHHPDIAARFGERRWFVRLEAADSAEKMEEAIIRAIGGDPQRCLQAALSQLNYQPTMLILDNLETPWEPLGGREAVHQALAAITATPELALLASIRGLEKVEGARWSVEHRVDALKPEYAADLFTSVAGKWTKDDPQFKDFVGALGGLPLAIHLVARRAHGRGSLMSLWEEWNRIGTEFVRHPDYVAGRLTCLEQSIELSLSSPRMKENQPAFRLLSFLGASPSGLTNEDARALLNNFSFGAIEKLCQIGIAIENGKRIDLLPPIRDYIRLRYQPNEKDTAQLTTYFLDKMILMEPLFPKLEILDRLEYVENSYDNFELALISSIDLDFNIDNNKLHYFGGMIHMGSRSARPLQRIAQKCALLGKYHDEATCHRYLGSFFHERAEYSKSLDSYRCAMVQFERYGDYMGQIDCLFGLSEVLEAQADFQSARSAAFSTISRAIMIGGVRGDADRMRGSALVAKYDKELDSAVACFESAIKLYNEISEFTTKAVCYLGLGDCFLSLGERSRARMAYENAKTVFTELRNIAKIAFILHKLGDVSLVDEKYEQAKAEYDASYQLYEMIGSADGMDLCARKIAACEL